MALTVSTMLSLGTKAPIFSLPDVTSGATVTLDTFAGKKALLVMFLCGHCPYVKYLEKELARLGRDYSAKDLGIVAISSNDAVHYPDDSPDNLKTQTQEVGFTFPYLYDAEQTVAKAYTAACTPDFFLFDQDRRLVYRGQWDDSRPSNGNPLTGNDLRQAIEAVLSGRPVPPDQKPSVGCGIKWKPGNEPAYFKG